MVTYNLASMIEAKFLEHPEDLGVVAVGFSGGQVRIHKRLMVRVVKPSADCLWNNSASQASMQLHQP
jgi:hypothetical protein